MNRPYFHNKRAEIDEMLRVDHAGEYGAIRIYQGQLAAIPASARHLIQEMLEGERKHLQYFEKEMLVRSSRPTLLLPFWHVAGFALGYLTALAGTKYAMLCTEAVEEVIDDHYKTQYSSLLSMEEKDLADKVEEHRLEEVSHKNIAIEWGSIDTMFYPYLKLLIGRLCKVAIGLSRVV